MGRRRARAFLRVAGKQADGGEPETGSEFRRAIRPARAVSAAYITRSTPVRPPNARIDAEFSSSAIELKLADAQLIPINRGEQKQNRPDPASDQCERGIRDDSAAGPLHFHTLARIRRLPASRAAGLLDSPVGLHDGNGFYLHPEKRHATRVKTISRAAV